MSISVLFTLSMISDVVKVNAKRRICLMDDCFAFALLFMYYVADCKCQIVLFIIYLLSNVVKVNHWWIQGAFMPWPYI